MTIEQSSTSLPPLRELAAEIGAAWLAEWRCVFQSMRQRVLDAGPPMPWVQFTGSGVVVTTAEGQSQILPADTIERVSPVFALKRATQGASSVALRISDEDILRPHIRLPRARKAILRKAIRLEMARLSPIDPALLYFDYAVDPTEGTAVAVRLRAVRRSVVDDAAVHCEAAGLKIAAIRLGEDARSADWRLFPIDRLVLLLTAWRQWRLPLLGVLAVVLCGLLLIASTARDGKQSAAIAQEIESTTAKAAVVGRLRAEIQHVAREQDLLVTLKRKPLLVATLAQLSRVLPDGTWVTDFQVAGRKVRIQGYSHSASRLIGTLGAAGFGNPQFEAPVTQDSTTNSQRFDLFFERQ